MDIKYQQASEELNLKPTALKKFDNRVRYLGRSNNRLSIQTLDSGIRPLFFLYDERSSEIENEPVKVKIDSKFLSIIRYGETFAFSGYFNLPEYPDVPIESLPLKNLEYQELWIQNRGKSIKLDKLPFHFIDKYYQLKFSSSGDYLICNPFTTRTAGYDSKEDGFFILYNLTNIQEGVSNRRLVECDACMNTFISNNKFIFQREIPIGHGFDGVHLNIYQAPLTNVNDTIRIASDIELLLLSSDEKYILGAKYLYGRWTGVILDIRAKKFQYLIGRDYLSHNYFYSSVKKKFVFDFGEQFVYVGMPKVFPFDAMKSHYRFTKKEEDVLFWKKYDPNSVGK